MIKLFDTRIVISGATVINPRNGLCLSALHDKAFDRGLITVAPDMTMRVSKSLIKADSGEFAAQAIISLEGKAIEIPQRFVPDPDFLRWHNKNIFIVS